MMDLHQCPVNGCEAEIALDRAMCAAHWRLVPRELKAAVWDAWTARQRLRRRSGPTQHHHDSVVAWHREAVAAAVAAVNDGLAKYTA